MLVSRVFSVVVFCYSVLVGCEAPRDSTRGEPLDVTERYEVAVLGKIDRQQMQESSGLARADSAATEFWTHGDAGSPPVLYRVARTGALRQTVRVGGANNYDGEDLTRDGQGRLYLGDFGNNRNDRRDLTVYRFDPAHPAQPADTIRFRYADQHAFPPGKAYRNFDCEAFYYAHDSLFLFTKNRAKGGGLLVKQYGMPARPGKYVLAALDSLALETWVTAADISTDGRTVALLGYGFVYLFEGAPAQRVFDRPRRRIQLETTGQAEALTFVNNHDFVLSNESGKLFQVSRTR